MLLHTVNDNAERTEDLDAYPLAHHPLIPFHASTRSR
jgi:hypothetical protein